MTNPEELRLLLDESILGFKKVFRDRPEYNVLTCLEAGHARGTDDRVLIDHAAQDNRFFVTNDVSTVTEIIYPPCNGKSIIRLPRNKISRQYVLERIEAFRTLHLAHRAVGHFTYLEDDRIKIVNHNEPIEREFNDYEDFKNIKRN